MLGRGWWNTSCAFSASTFHRARRCAQMSGDKLWQFLSFNRNRFTPALRPIHCTIKLIVLGCGMRWSLIVPQQWAHSHYKNFRTGLLTPRGDVSYPFRTRMPHFICTKITRPAPTPSPNRRVEGMKIGNNFMVPRNIACIDAASLPVAARPLLRVRGLVLLSFLPS